VRSGALGIVETLGELAEFFHSQVEDSLVFRWRNLALFKLVGSVSSDIKLRIVHCLVHFLISFVSFYVAHLTLDISLQVSNLGGFPGVTEKLDCLQSELLLVSGEFSVLAHCVKTHNKLDWAALKGLSLNLIPNLGLNIVGFSFGSHLLSNFFLLFVVGFFFLILNPAFFINLDQVMNSRVERIFKQA